MLGCGAYSGEHRYTVRCMTLALAPTGIVCGGRRGVYAGGPTAAALVGWPIAADSGYLRLGALCFVVLG